MRSKITLGIALIVIPIVGIIAAAIGMPVGGILLGSDSSASAEHNIKELVSGPRERLGIRTAATVEKVKPAGGGHHHVNFGVEVTLMVEPEGGSPYRATTETVLPVNDLDAFKVGKRVVVRVDRNNPQRLAIDPNPPAKWLERINRPTAGRARRASPTRPSTSSHPGQPPL